MHRNLIRGVWVTKTHCFGCHLLLEAGGACGAVCMTRTSSMSVNVSEVNAYQVLNRNLGNPAVIPVYPLGSLSQGPSA